MYQKKKWFRLTMVSMSFCKMDEDMSVECWAKYLFQLYKENMQNLYNLSSKLHNVWTNWKSSCARRVHSKGAAAWITGEKIGN